MPKLTIIVNCTDRKSLAPAPNLRIGSLPKGDNETRFEAWRQRVESAQPQVQLLDLYQGEAWQQVRGLANDAQNVGYTVRTMVASAGLGLTRRVGKGKRVRGDVRGRSCRLCRFWGGHAPRLVAAPRFT